MGGIAAVPQFLLKHWVHLPSLSVVHGITVEDARGGNWRDQVNDFS